MNGFISTRNMPWHKGLVKNIAESVFSLFDSFSSEFKLELVVPTNIVKRSLLICRYISEETEQEFGLDDLLMFLYNDFVDCSVKKYEPKKLLRDLSRVHNYDDVIKISFGGNEVYEVNKSKYDRKLVEIVISKDDTVKGQLILDELKDLYGFNMNITKMFYVLWVNFIEDYKRGEKNKYINSVVIRYNQLRINKRQA